MAYKLVRIDNETIPGGDVKTVFAPGTDIPFWYIELRDGTVFKTTHPVTVIEESGKGAKA